MLEIPADIAIVVGGYNSSNTSHLVELCENRLPTFYIKSEDEIISKTLIRHFKYNTKEIVESSSFLPDKEKIKIILTSGASCPDAVVDRVLKKLLSYFDDHRKVDDVLKEFSHS